MIQKPSISLVHFGTDAKNKHSLKVSLRGFVQIYMSVLCRCVPACADVCGDQRTSCHSSGAPHFVSRDCLLAWHFPGEPHWMTSEHQGHVCLCLLELAFQAGAAVPSLFFYLGFVGQNWSPHAFKASPSRPDPSPQTPPPTISLQVYHAVLQSFSFPNTKGSDLHQSFYNSEGRREYGHNGSFGPKL